MSSKLRFMAEQLRLDRRRGEVGGEEGSARESMATREAGVYAREEGVLGQPSLTDDVQKEKKRHERKSSLLFSTHPEQFYPRVSLVCSVSCRVVREHSVASLSLSRKL